MEKGTVKFFNGSKGFGFIKRANGNGDVFVHVSECRDELQEGDEVEFEVKDTPKGQNATNVRRA